MVHDPQPLAIRRFRPEIANVWVWRCHVDSSAPHPPAWAFVRPFVEEHDHAVFTLPSFVPADIATQTSTMLPAIDPLSSKNRALPAYIPREVVAEFGVDLTRPLLVQVSRFDPWKDPLGVVHIWRRLREEFPTLQLGLIGSMATDDPEGWRVYQEIERQTRGERDCFVLTNQMGVAHHEVNAFQCVADVAVQKSIREGFGLVVSETLWKGTAMVGGRAGGIPTQLEDGVSGFVAESGEEFADRISRLLRDATLARDFGAAGARRVRERFLLPRLIRDRLNLLRQLAAVEPAPDGEAVA